MGPVLLVPTKREGWNKGAPQAGSVVLGKKHGLCWESWWMNYVHGSVTLPLEYSPSEILPRLHEELCPKMFVPASSLVPGGGGNFRVQHCGGGS